MNLANFLQDWKDKMKHPNPYKRLVMYYNFNKLIYDIKSVLNINDPWLIIYKDGNPVQKINNPVLYVKEERPTSLIVKDRNEKELLNIDISYADHYSFRINGIMFWMHNYIVCRSENI